MPSSTMEFYTPHGIYFYDQYGETISVIEHIQNVRVSSVDKQGRPHTIELSGRVDGVLRQNKMEELARLSSMSEKSHEQHEKITAIITTPQVQMRGYLNNFVYSYDGALGLAYVWSATFVRAKDVQQSVSRPSNIGVVDEIDYVLFTIDTEAHTDLMTLAEDLYDGDYTRYYDILELNEFTMSDESSLNVGDTIRLPK